MNASTDLKDSLIAPPSAALSTPLQNGAEIVLRVLREQRVEVIFGYPGGAVLPIYDALFKQNRVRHVLVRHEQAAVHAAEGYARSTGRVGVVLVTSGPGATNAVTGLLDALMDSVPLVCLTGQVPTHMIGNGRLPGGRHHRHHPAGDQAQLPGEASRRPGPHPARGVLRRPQRPGPGRWWWTCPRTSWSAPPPMRRPRRRPHRSYRRRCGSRRATPCRRRCAAMRGARRPLFYTPAAA